MQPLRRFSTLGKVQAESIFKNLYPWNSLENFNQHILDSIVYNSNGVIAINKPYGVKINQEEEKDIVYPIKATLTSSSALDTNYSISQAIPFLQTQLNEKDLCIVKSAERFTSGVTILASNQKIENKIRQAIATVKCEKTSPFKYLTVVVGQLQQPTVRERVGITLKKSETGGINSKHSVILNEFSVHQVKNSLVKPANVDVETIAVDNETNTSLLKISSTQLKWYFLRVYLAHKGVPIFGDNMFGPRVRWMFGKPFLISVNNQAAYNPPTISHPIRSKLFISENNINHIPIHLHLNEVHLKLKGHDQIVIRAEPMNFFQWTCHRLGFNTENTNVPLEEKKFNM